MTTENRRLSKGFLPPRTQCKRTPSEVDQGGTIRGIRTIGSQNILKDLFHTEVVHFERKKWPELSNNQVAMAEALLHRQYDKMLQQLQTRPKEERDEGA